MAVNKKLLQGAAAGGLVPSEHFGVVLYEGDGSTSHSINGGKFGAGGYFTNAGVVTIPSSVIDTNKHSLSVWFNTGSTSGTQTVFEFNTGNRIIFRAASTDSNKANFGGGGWFDHGISFSANTWYHLVITFNSGSPAKIYVNGSLQHTTGNISKASDGSANYLGANNSSGGNNLQGKIDQFRIFQKELSSSEVSTLYAETDPESLDPLSEDTTDTLQVLGDSSCIATYRFENNEDDLSGNYNLTGNEIQYAAGRYGQAASFNGSSSYAEITSSPPQPSSGILSASVWVKSSSTSRQEIFEFEISDGGSGFQEYLSLENFGFGGTNSIRCTYNNSQVSNTNNEAVSDDLWHHFVVSVGSSTLKVYKDGSEIASGSITATQKTVLSLNVGFRRYNTDLYFNGEIDQFRIFNKELSASEVTTLYNENPLVASYRFEGNANDDTRNYDGTATNVTYEYGLNFTPDFVWYKTRTQAYDHNLSDSTRGAAKQVRPNRNIAEVSATDQILSFDTGGFTVGSGGDANKSGDDYVAWCLKANGGTTSSNSDGSITSTVQVNEQAGFSIVKYTGNSSSNQTIGHSLGLVPKMIIVKKLGQTSDWAVYHTGLTSAAYRIKLNSTDGELTSNNPWNSTDPTSSLFTVKSDAGNVNTNGQEHIAYCFAEIDGFSKFGTYTGTGGTGNIVETGFEPAFVMTKKTSGTSNWAIFDNKRNTSNPRINFLRASSSDQEQTDPTNYAIDFFSNGFQWNGNGNDGNISGETYIYMAFAADPDTEAPTVAKSFSTVTYTGDGTYPRAADGSDDVTLDFGFPPGLVWGKSRDDGTLLHVWVDRLRGNDKQISSNLTDAEATKTSPAYTFDGNTLVVTSNGNLNNNDPYVAWAWKADDNEPTINTEGSIDSLVSANANAGFSIVKYTTNGSNSTRIGHGLSSAPVVTLYKKISGTGNWQWLTTQIDGSYDNLNLNTTAAKSDSSLGVPTSTTICAESGSNGTEMIAYCWHEVSGYSKFGTYTGNGSSNNAITGLGFQPDWLMIKNTTDAGNDWQIYDSVRTEGQVLLANSSNADADNSSNFGQFDSDGFTVQSNNDGNNKSGSTYLYMAFKIN